MMQYKDDSASHALCDTSRLPKASLTRRQLKLWGGSFDTLFSSVEYSNEYIFEL